MTTEKSKIAFYIFAETTNKESVRIGTAYHHKNGKSMNIVIGKARYTAFAPKTKSEQGEGA